MRYKLIFLLLICVAESFAQPVNDDCDGLIDLGIAPYCPDITLPENSSEIFNNIDATATDIGSDNNPSCFNAGLAPRDVWFAFTSSDTIFDYTITVMGVEDADGNPAIINPQVAMYRGSCGFGQLAELYCASADLGENMVELDATGLTPNVVYYLRITDYTSSGTPNPGAFKLCIDEIDPVNLITEDGSSSCTGVLYDSGGPDGDYDNGENNTFVICPNEPSACINFGLNYFNIEGGDNGGMDQLLFYDGDSPNPGNLIGTIGGPSFDTGSGADGGVCFQVQATSGCLTVQFVSDNQVTFEGFEGQWECSAEACLPNLPIIVDSNAVNAQIVEALSTPQTQVQITNIICDNASYGTFLAIDESDLGLGKGLLLTTGEATNARGPNNSTGGENLNEDRFQLGDADLDVLSNLFGNGEPSFDACIVELDVFANTDELVFEYIFGSEEYPEFVNDLYNDIFAFLISGPGITGIPEINNQLNIATLPDVNNTFVQINSVNNFQNWEHYRNNILGQATQYDGLTSGYLGTSKSLTARTNVIPCNNYRLKLAIADRGDGFYDSGVFVSEIKGGTPDIDIVFNSGIDYLIESCTDVPDQVVFNLVNSQDEPVTFDVVITGTATQNEDYILEVPDSLTFVPGNNNITFPISVLDDLNNMEGIETINISLINDFGCGSVILGSLDIELHDILNVEINTGLDTARYCVNTSIELVAEGAANYFWEPITIFDNPFSATTIATPEEDGWIYVEGKIGENCIDRDSIYLLAVDPTVLIAPDTLNICLGDSIQIFAENNVNGGALSWSPSANILNPNLPEITVFPTLNTTYTATVFINENCQSSDQVFIDVDFLNVPDLIPDSTLCQHTAVVLAELLDPDISSTEYIWSPMEGLVDTTVATPIATPQTTVEYQLISTSSNGACADTSSTTISVLPADASIAPSDTVFLCLGETINLVATTSTGNNDNFFWTPDDGSLSSTTDLEVVANPINHTTYYTNLSVGECFVQDSVVVRVDSLPADMHIMADPHKDPYCVGEIVSLVAPIYEPANFPDLSHQWLGQSFETSDTLYNIVLTTVDTFTYTRLTVNGGCIQEDSIVLNVLTDEGITIMPMDTSICPGESVNIVATSPNGGTFSWTPEEGLSCVDCQDPIATPAQTTNYSLEIAISECTFDVSTNIIVGTEPVVDLIDDITVCPGTPLVLNAAPAELGVSYTWSAQNDPDFSSDEANVRVTPTSTEVYTLTVENDCTDGPTSYSVTVTVPQPAALVGVGEDQTLCAGESFDLNALLEPSPSSDDRLTWIYDGESEIGTNTTFTATNSDFAVFYYTHRIDNQECETFSDSVLINVLQIPTVELIPNQAFCFGNAVDLSLNLAPEEAGVIYSWSAQNDLGFSSNAANVQVTPTSTEVYTLTVENECTDGPVSYSVTVTVSQPAALIGVGEDQTLCFGESIDLNAVLEPVPSADDRLTWIYDGESEIGANTTFTATNSGFAVFHYTHRFGNQECETFSDSVLINVLQRPILDLIPSQDFCFGDAVDLSLNLAPEEAGVTYTWSSPNDPTFSSQIANPVVSPTETTTYNLVASIGDCSISASVDISIIPPAILIAGEDQIITEDNTSVALNAALTGGGGNPFIDWQFNGASVGETLNTTILVDLDEVPNDAVVLYRNICGEITDTIHLSKLVVEIPNIFSPNDDGTNDVFRPFYAGSVDMVEVYVYNRWGQEVFVSTDPANPGWDGMVNSQPAPSDVYIYLIKVGVNGTVKEASGQLTLVR